MAKKKQQQSDIGLMPKASKEKTVKPSKDTEQMQEIIDSFTEMVQNGLVNQFVIVGLDDSSNVVLASWCEEIVNGIGLLEMGKLAYINQQSE